MKKITLTFLIMLFALTSNIVRSDVIAEWNKGLEAYNNGDYATALSAWENLAYQGDTDARYQVGEIFFIGLGVEKNYETAIYWHTLAANQKNIESESRLGDIYSSDTLKDYDTAAFWYKRAANHGHLNAHFNLGILYGTGTGVEKNHILGYMHSVISQKDNGEYDKKFMTNQELTTAKKLVKQCKAKRTNKCNSVIIDWEKAELKKKDIEERNKKINFARENSKNNPGFRDLKPGMPLEDYYKNCVSLNVSQNKCYGIQNIKFSRDIKKIDGVEIITTLYLDMGPISGEDDGSSNLYLDMVKNFNAKYSPDYSFSERDKEVFNAAQKKELLAVYSNGQVVLKISRKTGENTFLEKLWLDIEYRDVKTGKRFLEKNRPVKASLNDF